MASKSTKLLLISDVEDLGRSGDIVAVRAGFARNFLLPHQYAVFATANALRMQEKLQEERKQKAEQDKKEAEKISSKLEGVVVTKIVKIDPEGNMYGSVSVHDILDLLKEQGKMEVEKRAIQLKQPIRELGSHSIPLKLKEGVTATFTLVIEPEAGSILKEAKDVKAKESSEG